MSTHPCEIILYNEIGRRLPGVSGSPDDVNSHSCGQDAVILVDDVTSAAPYWCCYRHLPTKYKRILQLQVLRDLLSTLATNSEEFQLGDRVRGKIAAAPSLITEDRLLDIVYDILQANLAYLNQGTKGTHLEHEDHEAYFKQHVKLLRDLLAEAQQ